jgi:inosine-uridine nucleoside N-ribohydrolase
MVLTTASEKVLQACVTIPSVMRFLTTMTALAICGTIAAAQDKVIFDTDSGFFGDDGAALVMLLRSPDKVRVVGVTVVSGNVWSRQGAEYMFDILQAAGHPTVPLYMGANLPLKRTKASTDEEARRWGPLEFTGAFERPPDQMLPPYGGKLTGRKPEQESAADFIVRTVEADPGQVTFLEIGPMTNLAMALRKRPGLAAKIKRLVFMGGNLYVPGNASKAAEFNFWFDPEAANEVLRSDIPEKIMFGLDICNHAPLGKKEFDQLIAVKTPVTERIAEDFGNRYPGFFKKPDASAYIWDALAAAWLLDTGFVTRSEQQDLEVDVAFGNQYGRVRAARDKPEPPPPSVQVMVDLDFPHLFALYKRLLTKR